MKVKSLAIIILLISALNVAGQKIKYKDLFPTLNAKNWTEGGPQLMIYLSDPKNADDANPNLQVGLMMEDKFFKLDASKDTTALFSAGDSAVFFLEKAKGLITEKELKKNDEYYQSFFRRDLRTGEFGIKVSDVHLDIEKKVESIEQRMSDSRNLNKVVKSVEEGSKSVSEKYKELTSRYTKYNNLLLSADKDALALLDQIKTEAANVKKLADEVKDIANRLGTEKFRNDIKLKEITYYASDGITVADLSEGEIELWDYEGWAIDVNSEINGSIGLLKSMIANYSKTVREKKNQIKRSIDVEVDTLSQDLTNLFDKYDPESLVKRLLLTEASEARIMKMVDLSINKPLQDSSLVGAQLDIFSAAMEEAEKMSQVVQSIDVLNLDEAKKNYPDYINSFFQTSGTAGNYIAEMKTWSARQKAWLTEAVEYWSERNKWGIEAVEGEPEKRISLLVQEAPESEFFTMGASVSTNGEVIVFGANLSTKKGFIYSFDEARYSRWNLEFKLPGEANFQLKADTIPAAPSSISFYIQNELANEKNFSIVSFNQAGALNWSTTLTVPKPPVDFKFDDLTQELTILLYPEEELPLDNDELGYLVIDRTGAVR